MRLKKSVIGACAALGLFGLTCAASAEVFSGNFLLSGDQQVPPNDSNAIGAGQIVFDSDNQTFDLSLAIFGIGLDDLMNVGPNSTPVHIHMAPPGSNGPMTRSRFWRGSRVRTPCGSPSTSIGRHRDGPPPLPPHRWSCRPGPSPCSSSSSGATCRSSNRSCRWSGPR